MGPWVGQLIDRIHLDSPGSCTVLNWEGMLGGGVTFTRKLRTLLGKFSNVL